MGAGSPIYGGPLRPRAAAPARKSRCSICALAATPRPGSPPRRPAPCPRTFPPLAGTRSRRRRVSAAARGRRRGVPRETPASPPRRPLPPFCSRFRDRLRGGVRRPAPPGGFRPCGVGRRPARGRARAASRPAPPRGAAGRSPRPAWPPRGAPRRAGRARPREPVRAHGAARRGAAGRPADRPARRGVVRPPCARAAPRLAARPAGPAPLRVPGAPGEAPRRPPAGRPFAGFQYGRRRVRDAPVPPFGSPRRLAARSAAFPAGFIWPRPPDPRPPARPGRSTPAWFLPPGGPFPLPGGFGSRSAFRFLFAPAVGIGDLRALRSGARAVPPVGVAGSFGFWARPRGAPPGSARPPARARIRPYADGPRLMIRRGRARGPDPRRGGARIRPRPGCHDSSPAFEGARPDPSAPGGRGRGGPCGLATSPRIVRAGTPAARPRIRRCISAGVSRRGAPPGRPRAAAFAAPRPFRRSSGPRGADQIPPHAGGSGGARSRCGGRPDPAVPGRAAPRDPAGPRAGVKSAAPGKRTARDVSGGGPLPHWPGGDPPRPAPRGGGAPGSGRPGCHAGSPAFEGAPGSVRAREPGPRRGYTGGPHPPALCGPPRMAPPPPPNAPPGPARGSGPPPARPNRGGPERRPYARRPHNPGSANVARRAFQGAAPHRAAPAPPPPSIHPAVPVKFRAVKGGSDPPQSAPGAARGARSHSG